MQPGPQMKNNWCSFPWVASSMTSFEYCSVRFSYANPHDFKMLLFRPSNRSHGGPKCKLSFSIRDANIRQQTSEASPKIVDHFPDSYWIQLLSVSILKVKRYLHLIHTYYETALKSKWTNITRPPTIPSMTLAPPRDGAGHADAGPSTPILLMPGLPNLLLKVIGSRALMTGHTTVCWLTR